MIISPDVIEFFKRHNLYDESMFNYFAYNTTMVDYGDPDQRMFIGCFYIFDNRGKRLNKIHLNLPYVCDDITLLINIHELTHGIYMYKKIGKKVSIGNDIEVLPMLYEKIFVTEQNNPKLTEYSKYLDSLISSEKKYVIGLTLRDKLFNDYTDNLDEMEKKIKKLVRKIDK